METSVPPAPPRYEPGQEKSPFVTGESNGGFIAPENVQKCTIESNSWKKNFKFVKGRAFLKNVDWKKVIIILILVIFAIFIFTLFYVLVSTFLQEPTHQPISEHQIKLSRNLDTKSAESTRRKPFKPIELVEAVIIETSSSTTTSTTEIPSTTTTIDIETTQDKLHPMEYFGKNFDKNHAPDCLQHLASGAESGVFPIQRGDDYLAAYCDMEKSGGGWTVIQRRTNKNEGFYNRKYVEYINGFGSLNNSFWLGLKNIHTLAPSTEPYVTLRIELHGDLCLGPKCNGDPEGFWYGEWDFRIGDEKDGYALDISPATRGNLSIVGNYTDGFYAKSNGMKFTTIDNDQDTENAFNCAQFRNFGAWWHSDCTTAALNGLYGDRKNAARYMMWKVDEGRANGRIGLNYVIHPKESLMMIRPKY
ncbi:unnamed protein product [Caenorhabditis angaria]|uniref:Fibrinogen C-terminal domain-containing protein n=1 Tax=Caenorhabditis angaria TaxID=860376 RepID=A0A9P1N9V8_9PELO|nr:unnamed protein product [Caenorhabditis angaria]